MNDNYVGTAAELRAEFEAELSTMPSVRVRNTDGERAIVASAEQRHILTCGIDALFSLAESYEKRIAELETRLKGLLGLGGGLDTALAKRDARIEVQERRLGALEYSVDQVRDEVTGPLAERLAELIAASKATSEPAPAQPAPVDPLDPLAAFTFAARRAAIAQRDMAWARGHTWDATAAETVTLERKFAEELAEMLRDVKPDLEHYESNFTYDEFVEFVNRFQQVVWPNGMPF